MKRLPLPVYYKTGAVEPLWIGYSVRMVTATGTRTTRWTATKAGAWRVLQRFIEGD